MPRRPPDLDGPRARAVLERARRVPRGHVAAYGDLDPAAPRFAGAVLAACSDDDVPWHRIIRSDGTLTQGPRQASLLRLEGVAIEDGRVDLGRARWWSP